ncbi:MAG: hypothetical protein AB1546_10220 [bacterium]
MEQTESQPAAETAEKHLDLTEVSAITPESSAVEKPVSLLNINDSGIIATSLHANVPQLNA